MRGPGFDSMSQVLQLGTRFFLSSQVFLLETEVCYPGSAGGAKRLDSIIIDGTTFLPIPFPGTNDNQSLIVAVLHLLRLPAPELAEFHQMSRISGWTYSYVQELVQRHLIEILLVQYFSVLTVTSVRLERTKSPAPGRADKKCHTPDAAALAITGISAHGPPFPILRGTVGWPHQSWPAPAAGSSCRIGRRCRIR